jgi:sugar phosphate isomerase/epimerase
MLALGISSWFGYELPLEQRLDMIVRAGFSATCLWLGEEEPLVCEGRADRMPALVRRCGLTPDNVHAPFRHCNSLWSASESDRKMFQQECENALAFCGNHRIPTLVVHIASGLNPPPPTKAGIQIIRGLVTKAKNLRVTIALENTLHPGHLEPVFTEIQSPNLGFCYDCSHDFLLGQSRGAILKKWGHLLKATHISDARGERDDHLMLGEGTIDWTAFAAAFPRSSYKGTLMLEVEKHPDSLTSESFLKSSYQQVHQLAAMLG